MTHHAVILHLDGLGWHCSCGMRGMALHNDYQEKWAVEHIVNKRDTKSIARQTK